MFSLFENSTPQLYLDIDRVKAQMLGINVTDVFTALQTYLGSAYVNDFNLLGRTFRVTAQAERSSRSEHNVLKIRVRNSSGDTVPLGSFTTVRDITGPVARSALQSLSGGRARWFRGPRLHRARRSIYGAACGRDAAAGLQLTNGRDRLPADPRRKHGGVCVRAGVVFVFLVLAAQFESLTLPLAVILIVPMCLIASITGVVMRGMDNNILTQVGFIVLIGLAAKNAILIVEFAAQLEEGGRNKFEAATKQHVCACGPF